MHPGIFQWIKRLRNSIVKSLFAWPDCRGTALHLLIISWSHKHNPNVA